MFAFFEIALGLVIGGVGYSRIADNPLHGCCALLLAGFLIMTGFERRLSAKAVEQRTDHG
ncbi:MAG: hypothetical protein AAGU11_15640 [Syntrophobacteraceae bacterium]